MGVPPHRDVNKYQRLTTDLYSSARAEILASAQNMTIAHEESQKKTQEQFLSVFVFEEAEEVKV